MKEYQAVILRLTRHTHGSARGGHSESLPPLAHFAQPPHQDRFAARILRVVDVAELEEHLQLHQLLLDRGVVDQLLLDHALDLA